MTANRDKKSERGSAALEFALSFSLLWAVFAGVFQFGYSQYVYNALNSAVAMGARTGSRVEFDDPNKTFVTKIKNMVVYGSPNGGTTPLVPGLTPSHVNVTWTADSEGVPQTMTVAVQNYQVDTVFKNFTFHNRPSVTTKYAGVFKTAP